MIASFVDEPDRVEDLNRVVGIETRKDLRNRAEVAVDELAQTTVVVDSARAGAPPHEELEVGDAERVLDVDGDKADAKGVLCRREQTMPLRPGLGLARAILVGDAPNVAYAARLEVGRERQLTHRAIRSRGSHKLQ